MGWKLSTIGHTLSGIASACVVKSSSSGLINLCSFSRSVGRCFVFLDRSASSAKCRVSIRPRKEKAFGLIRNKIKPTYSQKQPFLFFFLGETDVGNSSHFPLRILSTYFQLLEYSGAWRILLSQFISLQGPSWFSIGTSCSQSFLGCAHVLHREPSWPSFQPPWNT